MKQINKRVIATALCAIVLLTTACSSEQAPENTSPMGRYVERILPYPEVEITKQIKRSDGSMDLYALDPETYEQKLFHSADGSNWEEHAIPWQDSGEMYVSDYAYDQNDEIYLMSDTIMDGDSNADLALTLAYSVYHVQADGSVSNAVIQWETEYQGTIFQDQFLVGDNGDLFVLQLKEGVTQYDGQTGEQKWFYQLTDGANSLGRPGQSRNRFAVGYGKLFLADKTTSSVFIYDTATGELLMSVPFADLTADSLMTLGSEGDLYIQNAGGIYRLVENGTLWERIVDGSLTSMSMPLNFTDFFRNAEGTFYITGSDSSGARLFRYEYDETVALLPTHELVIYTLNDSDTIRQAVGSFQRQYLDTRVNFQVAAEAEGVSKSELIRALNTELLAGGGPDIIIFDDLNVQTYIEKGALLDISETVQESGNLLPVVASSYEKDGAVYAVPAKLRLPVLAAESDALAQMTSLREVARFAQENPQLPLLGDLSYDTVFQSFIYSSAPAFLDNGRIDQTALREFLECLKGIVDVPAENDQAPAGESRYDTKFDFAFHRSHGYTEILLCMDTAMFMNAALEQRGDCDIQLLPGLADHVFVPMCITGINVNTTQAERAQDFIKLLLSEEVQSSNIRNGFPVNQDVLAASLKDTEEQDTFILLNTGIEGETLTGGEVSLKMQERIYELILSVKTPATLDTTLINMIADEARGYVQGSKTIEQALFDIEEATMLYLSE